jgi:hypothetical protein
LSPAPKLSIVVAVQHAESNLPDIAAALRPAEHASVEFIFCHAADGPTPGGSIASGGNIVERYGGARSLIPHLWRDGMLAARAPWVATTTAHCVPAADWVARLETHLGDAAAAIGGVIANDARASAMDWAIYLLRYTAYAAPQAMREVTDVAADNALYRRGRVVEQADLLAEGFWEPGFHARWRAKGHVLRLDPALCVTHRNRYSASAFLRQRVAHGRQFGSARAAQWPRVRRLAMLLASPLLPVAFLGKIVRTARRHPVCSRHVAPALGWLVLFAAAWGIGEAMGYCAALTRGRWR